MMKRALPTAGAALLLSAPVSAPAFADQLTIITQPGITNPGDSPAVNPDMNSGSTVSSVVIAPSAPPAPPVPPDTTAVWMPGHWVWQGQRQAYTWSDGKYDEPPLVRASWVPGHWTQGPEGWFWDEGHWN
jgi:hypothetical protein